MQEDAPNRKNVTTKKAVKSSTAASSWKRRGTRSGTFEPQQVKKKPDSSDRGDRAKVLLTVRLGDELPGYRCPCGRHLHPEYFQCHHARGDRQAPAGAGAMGQPPTTERLSVRLAQAIHCLWGSTWRGRRKSLDPICVA